MPGHLRTQLWRFARILAFAVVAQAGVVASGKVTTWREAVALIVVPVGETAWRQAFPAVPIKVLPTAPDPAPVLPSTASSIPPLSTFTVIATEIPHA